MKLKPYPKYKESGIQWIGEIPQGWEDYKIRYLGNFQNGNGFPEALQGQEEGEMPFLKVSDINDPNIVYLRDSSNYVTLKQVAENKWNVIPEKSILFPKIGEAINKNHRKINEVNVIIDNNMSAFIKHKEFNYKYVFYIFRELDMNDFLNVSAVPSINMDLLKSHRFPITPDNKDQQKIASFLDSKTSELNKTIEKDKKLIALLKEKRTALINHAVTKGLDPDVKMKDSGIEWIGAIPEGWGVHKLKYKTIINKKKLEDDINPNYVINYVDISNVDSSGNILDIEEQIFEDAPSRARRIPRYGDTILSTVRTYLKAIAYLENIPGNLIVSTGFAVLEPIKSINSKYLFYSTSSEVFIQNVIAYSKGVAYPAINPPELGQIPIIMPSLPEQTTIVNFLDKATAKIDKTIQKIEQKIKLLEEYKKSLIHHTVTGKMDVRGVEA